jgi:hypothetical protein
MEKFVEKYNFPLSENINLFLPKIKKLAKRGLQSVNITKI